LNILKFSSKRQTMLFLVAFFSFTGLAYAAPRTGGLDIAGIMRSPGFSNSVQILLALSLISLLPFLLISVTSFLRIIVVLSMIRSAIGTAQVPPNSILIGLALFMTVYTMAPAFDEMNKTAVIPYNKGQITQMKAFEIGMKPFQRFMLRQTRERDLSLFVQFAKIPTPKTANDIPVYVLIPSFMISELKTAFQIGFLLFVPFVIIDLVVANILLSLGMFMLSPVMVSLPFKILLFVLADGWNLITKGLLLSFR
jgi:flagellar biosynthetic protein FliP